MRSRSSFIDFALLAFAICVWTQFAAVNAWDTTYGLDPSCLFNNQVSRI